MPRPCCTRPSCPAYTLPPGRCDCARDEASTPEELAGWISMAADTGAEFHASRREAVLLDELVNGRPTKHLDSDQPLGVAVGALQPRKG